MKVKKTYFPIVGLCAVALLGACATSPVLTEFPAGAQALDARAIQAALAGKSFQSGTFLVGFGADQSLSGALGGRADSGTWRAEDGRVCTQFRIFPSGCGELRQASDGLYVRRVNGQVTKLEPKS